MRAIHLTIVALCAWRANLLADDQSDRQKLTGSWELSGTPQAGMASAWAFSNKQNAIRITQRDGGSKVADFECGTEGTSCDIKTGGRKAMVSLWFNGPRLVELETKGSEVVKRRFMILPQGDVMEMEVIPVVPSGKTETFQFKRASLPAGQQ